MTDSTSMARTVDVDDDQVIEISSDSDDDVNADGK